jgi:hypothetical protein
MEGKLTSKCMVERWKGLELRTLLEDPREKRANDSQFSPDCKAIMSVLASLNTKKTLYIGTTMLWRVICLLYCTL